MFQLAAEAVAFEKFGDDKWRTGFLSDIVDRQNVGMIQRSHRARLLFKSPKTVAIAGKRLRQDFQRDLTTESRVARPVHLSHSTRAEWRNDFVRTKFRAR